MILQQAYMRNNTDNLMIMAPVFDQAWVHNEIEL